jgi:hypothetical protein
MTFVQVWQDENRQILLDDESDLLQGPNTNSSNLVTDTRWL